MFSYCGDPVLLDGLNWLSCYLTTGKHYNFYVSFLLVILVLMLAAPAALFFGFGGALASRSGFAPLRWFGKSYIAMVRGIPDIAFFLFVPIALDQAFEYIRHKALCGGSGSVWQNGDFIVCSVAKLPVNSAAPWVHDIYGFCLALFSFAIVFGAFAGNTLGGAMAAVSKSQLDAAAAFGMNKQQIFRRILLPQMWVFAMPGLSNLWMILVKATPLLFLLGIEDAVYWARELGGSKTSAFQYPHPDWRLWYFLALLIFYLSITYASERVFMLLNRRLSRGQATIGVNEVS